jgi:septal ring-binding cell division protein DamX
MTRRGINVVLSMLVALALALPLAARVDKSKDAKSTASASMDLLNSATLAGKQLKPASYTVKVDETKVTFLQNGKVIAEAPVQWKDAANKAQYSSIVTDGNQIREIHFGGKTRYVEISQ